MRIRYDWHGAAFSGDDNDAGIAHVPSRARGGGMRGGAVPPGFRMQPGRGGPPEEGRGPAGLGTRDLPAFCRVI